MKPRVRSFTALQGRGFNQAEPTWRVRRVMPGFTQAEAWTEGRQAAQQALTIRSASQVPLTYVSNFYPTMEA